MMSNDEDTYFLTDEPEQEMIWESFEIDPTDVALANGVRFRGLRGVHDVLAEFDVKIIS